MRAAVAVAVVCVVCVDYCANYSIEIKSCVRVCGCASTRHYLCGTCTHTHAAHLNTSGPPFHACVCVCCSRCRRRRRRRRSDSTNTQTNACTNAHSQTHIHTRLSHNACKSYANLIASLNSLADCWPTAAGDGGLTPPPMHVCVCLCLHKPARSRSQVLRSALRSLPSLSSFYGRRCEHNV